MSSGVRALGRLFTLLLIILLALPTGILPSFGHATIEPDYTHCCIGSTGAHSSIPTSITGIADTYETKVPNEKRNPIIQVELIFPSDFKLVSIPVGESAWVITSAENAVTWSGGEIAPRANYTFRAVLLNPEIGFDFSRVYTFIVIAQYADDSLDAWRVPIEIIQPLRILGVDASLIGLGSVLAALSIPLIELVALRARRR